VVVLNLDLVLIRDTDALPTITNTDVIILLDIDIDNTILLDIDTTGGRKTNGR